MEKEQVIIIGGGPCGLAAAIALIEKGYDPLVIEKENVVHSIYRYPTHQTFFSSSDKLEIGGVPFITVDRKPRRNQALSYYREVVKRKQIRVHTFEIVEKVSKQEQGTFRVQTMKGNQTTKLYEASYVIIATGYYDHPNLMGVPGEELDHVHHYFKEAHPFFDKDVVVIGGKNSAVDATLELEKVGARVTVLYRGSDYSSSVKPWILPEFVSLINHEKVDMQFEAEVKEITSTDVIYEQNGKEHKAKADFVFAMTGYHPDHSFLSAMGVHIDPGSGRPAFDAETMETNVAGIFIAGVIAAGNNANEIFIENGRFHGDLIAAEIANRAALKS
ncbi:YpdA family putative bacillithiol disulfide reductase [Desertibacillus haloalkaliphilus]|uniref:YpdA family putative bacillithiol disulfide reductase n=1 Tax=Desertibacillus haloalkaliphilus TaxID=1328930 RepID=UPI001C27D98E|nr:YpdA family putative bacillithiol disulfide reductase [Desertibacillus haloalkaliphilus]MBU8907212.1 YpdA family putative bacillithiol disulfide reductase [Desertibacillus haloalkaliphilus]